MLRLTNIRKLGRYQNNLDNRKLNIYKGRKKGRSIDVIYYLYRGKRILINDSDFYQNYEKIKE